ncbi:hypothetical protein ZIOFF_012574 [Zingiber officinale]|uniref:TLC domain-containing protein n=1 Tax=Zingiber officinale TaxID=94328 RepID=A0A8J5I7P7_ZINOF|nr:hypothetical protein ZIOFF_012574 [Zingiber officinale]
MGLIWGAEEGYPHPGNFILVLCFALGSFLARFLLDRFVYKLRPKTNLLVGMFRSGQVGRAANDVGSGQQSYMLCFCDTMISEPCAMRLLGYKTALMRTGAAKWSKILKCTESMWKLTYYASVEIWVLSIIKHEPWSLDTKQYFEGWPKQELKFFRIGTIILALHDASDVFLEAAKLFKYSEKELAASVCFGFFAISWLLLRLVYFPFWIIKSSSYDSIKALSWMDNFPTMLYYIFNMMLLTLLVFHIYWWKLIFVMILKQLGNRGKVGEDIRSDSEGEED